jgi:catechol 2,3-dioxygenase-like lactoylglutathione lyase family enzyme
LSIVPELICSDISRSVAFYERLGFRVVYERAEERFALLRRDGAAALMLEQPVERDRLFPNAPLEHPYGRGVNLEIEVTDASSLFAAAADAQLILPLEERWYPRGDDEVHVRQFAIADPDGYVLRFSETRGTRPRQP